MSFLGCEDWSDAESEPDSTPSCSPERERTNRSDTVVTAASTSQSLSSLTPLTPSTESTDKATLSSPSPLSPLSPHLDISLSTGPSPPPEDEYDISHFTDTHARVQEALEDLEEEEEVGVQVRIRCY